MIDKARTKWEAYNQEKIAINESKNPFMHKLIIKMFPPYLHGTTFLTPFDAQRNLLIMQYLPLWGN